MGFIVAADLFGAVTGAILVVLGALGWAGRIHAVPAGLEPESPLPRVSSDVQTTPLSGQSYFWLLFALLLIFGVSFESPLRVVMLNRVGALSYPRLRRWRRGLAFGLFVFAAVATPGGDPLLMTALALTLLFEVSIQIAKVRDRGRARRRAAEAWDSWDPDLASPTDTTPSPLPEVQPLDDGTTNGGPAPEVSPSPSHR